MILAYNGIVPPKEWQHDPTLTGCIEGIGMVRRSFPILYFENATVAVLLAIHGIKIPPTWNHADTSY